MMLFIGVVWNRIYLEWCFLIGVRVVGVEIMELVFYWYFEIVDWGNVYVYVVKYGESVFVVCN